MYVKQFWFEIIFGICASILILAGFKRVFEKDNIALTFGLVDLAVLVLLGVYTFFMVVSSAYHFDHNLIFYFGVFYFLIRWAAGNIRRLMLRRVKVLFIKTIPVVIVVHVIIVLLQTINLFPPLHGYFNDGSTFGNPDMLGSYIAVLFPFCFMQQKKWKYAGYVAFVTGFILLIIIQARTALVATISCGILWLWINKSISRKQFSLLLTVGACIVAALIYWHPESVFGRFFIWFVSAKMITAKPLGWGLYAFENWYPDFQAAYVASNSHLPSFINPEIVHSPFNEFLNIGVSMGVVGLISYIFFVLLVFYYAFKVRSVLIYPLFSFLIISLFYFPFNIVPLVILVIPLLAIISGKSSTIFMIDVNRAYKKISLVSFCLFVTVILSIAAFKHYNQYQKWQQAVRLTQNEANLSKAQKLFSETYPSLKGSGRFLITYSNLEYRLTNNEKALALLEEADKIFSDPTFYLKLAEGYVNQEMFGKAIQKNNLAIHLAPESFMALYKKILLLRELDKTKEARLLAQKLLSKPIENDKYVDPIIIKSKLRRMYGVSRKPE